MSAEASIDLFVPCAIRVLRQESGLTGTVVQERLGVSGKSGFYRTEGRIVQTKWGRVCFTRPASITLDRLVKIAEVLESTPEEVFAVARELHAEHEDAIARGCRHFGVDREAFIQHVRGGAE